jgi:3-phenylpropionate/cinnamic acid dioxygenase small subunit
MENLAIKSNDGAAHTAAATESFRREVEDLVFREAELADTHQFDQWLSLWADEALYWVPCNEDEIDPRTHVSIIYEDRDKIEGRLYRLKGKHAHSQLPRSRLMRVVSNIRIVEGDARTQAVVTANFVLGEIRSGHQQVWIGRVRYVLKRVEGQLKIAEKKVLLLANDAPVANLTFII